MNERWSAIVLYYRAGPVLETTIKHLLVQTVPPEEILIVDNASGDGVVDSVAASVGTEAVRLLGLHRNEGYAGGMNRGLAALRSGADHVLFLTHETVLAPDAAEHLLRAAHATGASVAGPVLRRHRDSSLWSAGGRLDARGGTSHLAAARSAESPYEVDWLDGAALFVRRPALEAVGGFDERFFLYWEDVDVSTRLRAEGPVVCAPRAVAWQETGSTPPYYASRNRIVYWRVHGTARAVRRAIVTEMGACATDLARRRPRFLDAVGRTLGIVDGTFGALRPDLARIRSTRR